MGNVEIMCGPCVADVCQVDWTPPLGVVPRCIFEDNKGDMTGRVDEELGTREAFLTA